MSRTALLAACGRGPDDATLRAELERRLDDQFESGLFRVGAFTRRGSAPFRDPAQGRAGLFVYYDAELVFHREYDLASCRG